MKSGLSLAARGAAGPSSLSFQLPLLLQAAARPFPCCHWSSPFLPLLLSLAASLMLLSSQSLGPVKTNRRLLL